MLNSWLEKPQKILGQTGLMFLLIFTASVLPLSLDIYTPAVPHMSQHLSASKALVNLTLVGYYFFFAVGLLLFGPFSDRHGRKPVLVLGLLAYFVGSLACTLAPNIEFLIAARIAEALGAGAADSMIMSIVKDAFKEDKRQNAISFIQLMIILGPVLAPVLGAFITTMFSWRATFAFLAIIGLVSFVLSILFEETLDADKRVVKGTTNIIHQFIEVLKNPAFTWFLVLFTFFDLAFMAYVAVASYVYVSFFNLTEMGYAIFFGITALFSMLGPFLWQFVSRWLSARRFLTTLLLVSLCAGVFTLVFGQKNPVLFCVPMLIFAIAEAGARPLVVNILLSQRDDSAGTASSVINFMYTFVGSFGMLLVHLPFSNFVIAVGAILAGFMLFALVLWIALLRSKQKLKGIKD